jgi:hypothetical protein
MGMEICKGLVGRIPHQLVVSLGFVTLSQLVIDLYAIAMSVDRESLVQNGYSSYFCIL